MSDTPTPRTDAVCDRFSRGLMGSGEVRVFMEQLERELVEWHILQIWGGTPAHVDAFIKGQQERIHATQEVERELAAAHERIRRLEEAGDYMVNALWATDKQAVRAWNEAKEAKP